jgi:hypothetical protein
MISTPMSRNCQQPPTTTSFMLGNLPHTNVSCYTQHNIGVMTLAHLQTDFEFGRDCAGGIHKKLRVTMITIFPQSQVCYLSLLYYLYLRCRLYMRGHPPPDPPPPSQQLGMQAGTLLRDSRCLQSVGRSTIRSTTHLRKSLCHRFL